MTKRRSFDVFVISNGKDTSSESSVTYAHHNNGFVSDETTTVPPQNDKSTCDNCRNESLFSHSMRNKSQRATESKNEKNKTTQIKKSLGLIQCVAIMVAVTGHSSVFVSPSNILSETGSVGASLIIWLMGGFINMMAGLCFTELATMMPKAGGPYAYVMKTFGPLPGFLILWGYVILIAGPFWAFLSYTAALYIIQPFFQGCEQQIPDVAVKLLAGWIMITMVFLNCVYMKYVTKVQIFLSSTKLIACGIIIVIGGLVFSRGNADNFSNIFDNTTKEPGQWALAVLYSIFSYGGWQVITSLTEEVKNPGRDLPLSCYTSFIIVILKYVVTNAAYFTLLTPSEIVGSQAVAVLFIERIYSPLIPLMSVLVATTSIGALNASIMGHSRLLFAGARVGHMPLILGMINRKYLTPWPAIFVLLTLSLLMLYTGGLTDMMDFIGLFSTIMSLVCVMSLLYLRYVKPDENRPYKITTVIPVAVLIISSAVLVLSVYQKPNKMGLGLAILFSGIPVYWIGVLWQEKPQYAQEFIEKWTIHAQRILLIEKTS